MQLIEYLIFYLIIYTFTHLPFLSTLEKIKGERGEENERSKFQKYKIFLQLHRIDNLRRHNFQTLLFTILFSRDWSTYVILKSK